MEFKAAPDPLRACLIPGVDQSCPISLLLRVTFM